MAPLLRSFTDRQLRDVTDTNQFEFLTRNEIAAQYGMDGEQKGALVALCPVKITEQSRLDKDNHRIARYWLDGAALIATMEDAVEFKISDELIIYTSKAAISVDDYVKVILATHDRHGNVRNETWYDATKMLVDGKEIQVFEFVFDRCSEALRPKVMEHEGRFKGSFKQRLRRAGLLAPDGRSREAKMAKALPHSPCRSVSSVSQDVTHTAAPRQPSQYFIRPKNAVTAPPADKLSPDNEPDVQIVTTQPCVKSATASLTGSKRSRESELETLLLQREQELEELRRRLRHAEPVKRAIDAEFVAGRIADVCHEDTVADVLRQIDDSAVKVNAEGVFEEIRAMVVKKHEEWRAQYNGDCEQFLGDAIRVLQK